MLIRLPWLSTRKRLIIAVLIDAAIFAGLYSICFRARYDGWPAFSVPMGMLLLFWLVTSYVYGRYYDQDIACSYVAIQQLWRSLLALLISISVYLVYNWLAANTLGQADSRSLLLPFLLLQTSLSALAQLSLNKMLHSRFSDPKIWLVLGDNCTSAALQSATLWSRLPCELQQVNPEDFAEWLISPNLAGVVVNDLDNLAPEVFEKLLQLQAQGMLVVTTLDWCEHVLQRYPSTLLSREDLVRGGFAMSAGSLQRRLKRMGDVLVSALLLLLTLPLLMLSALLIWLEDRGPVFYSQLRTGIGGDCFRVWKLRTMRVDAEHHGPQWSSRGDPRITWAGYWLRRIRLDELPQLLSVLTGKMSLIGPRPERPEMEIGLEKQIPYYRLRYGIRPGLSGWAQVNYPYGASVEDTINKISYDLYYLLNFSFWLDILILLKTIRLVFNGRGSTPY